MDNKLKYLLIALVIGVIIAVVYYYYNKPKYTQKFMDEVMVKYFSKDIFPDISEEDLKNIANRRYKSSELPNCDENNVNACDFNNLPWWCDETVRKYSGIKKMNIKCSSLPSDCATLTGEAKDKCNREKEYCKDVGDLCYKDFSNTTNDNVKKFLEYRSSPYTGGSGLMQPSDSVLCKRISKFNGIPKSGYKYDFFDTKADNISKYTSSQFKNMIATELNNCPWNIDKDGKKKKDFTTL